MVELWTADKPVHHGRFFDIEGVAFEPKPVQSPRPPIFIGGNSKPALRRAARHDGWQPNPTDFSLPRGHAPLLEYLYAQPEYAGKEDTFDICWLGSPPMWEAEGFATASPSVLAAYRDRVVDWCAELGGNDVTRTRCRCRPPARSRSTSTTCSGSTRKWRPDWVGSPTLSPAARSGRGLTTASR